MNGNYEDIIIDRIHDKVIEYKNATGATSTFLILSSPSLFWLEKGLDTQHPDVLLHKKKRLTEYQGMKIVIRQDLQGLFFEIGSEPRLHT